jgi:hypothetical protein
MTPDGVCSCGDSHRPRINHRKRIPCWTYVGNDRYDVGPDGRVIYQPKERS